MPPSLRLTVPVKYSSTRSWAEADGLEDLGAGVGGDRGDAHLGHHLEHALAGGLDVVLDRLVGSTLSVRPGDHVLDGLEGQVRVDGAGAVADEQRHVVHLAGVAASTTRPTLVRVFSRTRWWCTAR
jgi:hypothetical protein